VLLPVAGCIRSATSCFYSTTLFNLTSQNLFRLVLDVHRFRLTAETTHHVYVCAVRSRRESETRLVLPTYPKVRLMFMSVHLSRRRVHHQCQGTLV
jgi:hypothetical protein